MAETKPEKTEKAEKAEKPAKAAAPSAPKEKNHELNKRTHKVSRWTLETCMRSAKRFDSREAWKVGHPSSFKAAGSKGWDTECCAHMTGKSAVVKSAKAPQAPKKTVKKPSRAA